MKENVSNILIPYDLIDGEVDEYVSIIFGIFQRRFHACIYIYDMNAYFRNEFTFFGSSNTLTLIRCCIFMVTFWFIFTHFKQFIYKGWESIIYRQNNSLKKKCKSIKNIPFNHKFMYIMIIIYRKHNYFHKSLSCDLRFFIRFFFLLQIEYVYMEIHTLRYFFHIIFYV